MLKIFQLFLRSDSFFIVKLENHFAAEKFPSTCNVNFVDLRFRIIGTAACNPLISKKKCFCYDFYC